MGIHKNKRDYLHKLNDMRFKTFPHKIPRPITGRRLARAKQQLKADRDKFPLLSDWVEEEQETPEERFQEREAFAIARHRLWIAQSWRRSRALLRLLPLRLLPLAEQYKLLALWNSHHCPTSEEYFATLLWDVARPYVDEGIINLPDLGLDPRYRIQKLLDEAPANGKIRSKPPGKPKHVPRASQLSLKF